LDTRTTEISSASSACRPTLRVRRWLPVLLIVVVPVLVAGCGRNVPPYWPGLSVGPERVYVAETSGQVFALDPSTGNALWSYPKTAQSGGGLFSACSARTPSDGPFFAAPTPGSELVYLSSAGEPTASLFRPSVNTSGLRALNTLGVLQWEFKGTDARSVASPTLTDNTVYMSSSDHSVYAIDTETHDARWAFETGNYVWARPVVSSGVVYVASMDHRLYAVDAGTGDEMWRFDQSTSALPSAPALADGTLYVGSLGGSLYAVDAANGSLQWQVQVDGGLWATPRVEGSVLYFGTLSGFVYARDARDGSPIWEHSVGGEVRGTPAYVDGVVYIGSENGQLYALSVADGAEQTSPLGQTLANASIFTSPIYDGQRLYVVATNAEVYALDLSRNAVLWKTNPLQASEEGQ
jgi:outer membrane protein assembly factor BamB